MYVRGKPWALTVDDLILYNNQRKSPEHVEYNLEKPSMWGPLLEKAWSKIDATFLNSESGFTFQAMRAVLGCPVAYYFTETTKLSSKDLWRTIRNQMLVHKYLFVASTESNGNENEELTTNECGLTNAHAFPVLAAFPLYNRDNSEKVDHMLYMMRDPRGHHQLTDLNTRWHPGDSENWTDNYRKQVPDGIDPLDWSYHQKSGVFFIAHSDFKRCFSGFAQARYKGDEGYSSDWYDQDGNELILGETRSPKREYAFEVPENRGSIYITVESYYLDMIPEACYSDKENPHPFVDIEIYQNDKLVGQYLRKPEFQPYWFTVHLGKYRKGDVFTIKV